MAGELTYASSSIMLAQALYDELGLLLADRASLLGHPAIMDVSDLAGRGSATIMLPLVGLDGYDEMADVGAETDSAANTAVTDASPTLTLARRALAREVSDLHQLVDASGLNIERLAQDMLGAYLMHGTTLICSVLPDFTASQGTSGVNMSYADFEDAVHTCERANVPGPLMAVLAEVQVPDLQKSIGLLGGAVQYKQATQEMLDAKGQGYIGRLLNVDLFKSSKCPTANSGADRVGAVFGRGAIAYGAGNPRRISQFGGQIVFGPGQTPIMVEFDRDAKGGMTDIVGSAFNGVTLMQDAMGCKIVTDA